ELNACRRAGFDPEIVPGVTTASGAAAARGISLTRRREAPRLQFVTAHGADGGLPPGLDLRSLADPAVTTCIYMGMSTISRLALELIARGLPAATPARLVVNATRPDMASRLTTLDAIADAASSARGDGPGLILIGNAVGSPCERGEGGFHGRAHTVALA
ncbi:MAG: SAM-dependent methyltransferase, partial [Beijerinckiaceae bacterium]